MSTKGDKKEPTVRVQFRLPKGRFDYAQGRADHLFDGNLTEFFKYLLTKDRETANDAVMWLQKVEEGIAEVEEHLAALKGQRDLLKQQVEGERK